MKKISLVTSQGKKQMCVAELIVLSESQYEKLMDKRLAKQVDSIAKDLHVDWAIEETGNANILGISRTTADVVDDAFYHDLEIASINFMKDVDKLQLSTEAECPSHEDATKNQENVEFVKALLKEVVPNKNMRVIVAEIVPSFIPGTCIRKATISTDLLREMCKIYLESYHEFDYDKS